MKKSLICITLLILAPLITSSLSFSEKAIIPIKTFKEVDFNAIKKDSLVIFDVDETLIQPQDTFLINEHTPQGISFMQSLPAKYPAISNTEWVHISSIMLKEAPRPLIEPEIINKIQNLLNKNILVMACTAMNTGPYGIYPSLEQWRYEHLTSLGFKTSFDDLIMNIKGERKPVFYRGILCTDMQDKGPVVSAFLDSIDLHPKKIIMFEDTLDSLVSVHEECKKRGIKFKGYHYQGARQKAWDDDIIQLQADYLVNHKHWITDEEARKLVNTTKNTIEQSA